MIKKIETFCFCLFIFIAAVPTYANEEATEALNPLFEVMAKRLSIMKDVALYKWHNHLQVEDLYREERILERTTEKAISLGLQPASSRNFFQMQMDAAKAIQIAWHEKWRKMDNLQLPEGPNLKTEIRPSLNSLGEEIMHLLAADSIWLAQLSSKQLCDALIPKLDVELLPLDAKIKVCKSLSEIRPVVSPYLSFTNSSQALSGSAQLEDR